MKQPLPESYLNLLAGADTLAAWQPSVNVLEDISNWNWQPDKSQTASQLNGSAHGPGASVAGVKIFPEAPIATLHQSGSAQGHKSQQLAAPDNPNQQTTWSQSQRQQAVEQPQERHLPHSASLQQDEQLAAMQQPLLPSHPHQQQQLQQSSNPMPPLKRPRGRSLAALENSDWRSVKRSSCSFLEHQPTRQLQLEQQPTASNITARPQESNLILPSTGATDPGSSAGRPAAAASPALMSSVAVNSVADDVELCLPDSQPEVEYHVALHHQHHAATAAQAPAAPAAIGSHTSCAARLIPYIDFIPATETEVAAAVAAAAAGPVLFRDYVPATEFPAEGLHQAQPTNGPVDGPGSIKSTARLAPGAPVAAVLLPEVAQLAAISTSVTAAAADGVSTTATPKPCTALHEALTPAAVLQQRGGSGLVLLENFVPATVLSEYQPEQLVTADAAGSGQVHMKQQHSAATAAAGAHRAAGQAPPAVAGGDSGGGARSQDKILSGCCPLCGCSSHSGPCSSGDTSSKLVSSDDEDCNLQQEQQHCGSVQQHAIHNAVCWRDIGETQPQPHAITHPRHLSPHHQQQCVLLGSSGQQQLLLAQHQYAANPAVLDAGETQPQPTVVLQRQQQQQQQQLIECWHLLASQQQAYLDLEEVQPLPVAFQQPQQELQLFNGRQPADIQQLEGYLDAEETQPQPGVLIQRQLPRHHAEDLQQQDQQPQQEQNVLQQQACIHPETLEQQHRKFEQEILTDQQQQQQQRSGRRQTAEAGAADACPITAQGPANIEMQGPAAMAAPLDATVIGVPDLPKCCHTSTTAGASSTGSTGLQLGLAPQAIAATPSQHMMIPSAATDCDAKRSTVLRQSLPGTYSRKAAGAAAAVAATSGGALGKSPSVSRHKAGVDRDGGMRAPADGWHLPARHRKWNTAPKPGSIMSFWNKAGVLDSK